MLPSPAELCERSRFYLEAARDTTDTEAKRRFAACALILAQVAEAIERNKGAADANAAGLARVIADALATAREAPSDERRAVTVAIAAREVVTPDPHADIRAWRLRAAELRATADQFAVPSAQESLRRTATNYERRADMVEAAMAGTPTAPDERKQTG